MVRRKTEVLTVASFVASVAFVIGVKAWVGDFSGWRDVRNPFVFDLGGAKEKTVARVVSPDERRTAVVVESVAALSANAYFVRVDGEEAAMAYGATTGGKYGVRVRWLDAGTLELAFDHARFTRVGTVDGLRVVVKGKVDPPESLRPASMSENGPPTYPRVP